MKKSTKATPEIAKKWLKNLDDTHKQSMELIAYALWSVNCCKIFMNNLDGTGPNVISIKSKEPIRREIPPPPEGYEEKTFEEVGRELDRLIKRINTLLPD